MWGVSSLHTPRNARAASGSRCPPPSAAQTAWMEGPGALRPMAPRLCSQWGTVGTRRQVRAAPSADRRCTLPPARSPEPRVAVPAAVVCVPVSTASQPAGSGHGHAAFWKRCGRLELSSPEAHPWPLGTTPLPLKPATAPGQAHVGPRGREGTVAGQPGLGVGGVGAQPKLCVFARDRGRGQAMLGSHFPINGDSLNPTGLTAQARGQTQAVATPTRTWA